MLATTFTSEVTKLKEKVRVLEVRFVTSFLPVTHALVLQKSHISLKRKVSDQAAELNQLRKMTSPEISASEATPDGPIPLFLPPRGPFHRSPIYSPVPREQDIPVNLSCACVIHAHATT